MQRLPADSLTRTTPESRTAAARGAAWDSATELLAQLVDLTGILAADRRIKGDPPKVPRPDWLGKPANGTGTGGGKDDGFRHALSVLRATSKNTYASTAAV